MSSLKLLLFTVKRFYNLLYNPIVVFHVFYVIKKV